MVHYVFVLLLVVLLSCVLLVVAIVRRPADASARHVSVARDCLSVILTGIAFAVVGGSLGYAVGMIAPEILRAFAGLPIREMDPSQIDESFVGWILGAAIGLSGGVFIRSAMIFASPLQKSTGEIDSSSCHTESA